MSVTICSKDGVIYGGINSEDGEECGGCCPSGGFLWPQLAGICTSHPHNTQPDALAATRSSHQDLKWKPQWNRIFMAYSHTIIVTNSSVSLGNIWNKTYKVSEMSDLLRSWAFLLLIFVNNLCPNSTAFWLACTLQTPDFSMLRSLQASSQALLIYCCRGHWANIGPMLAHIGLLTITGTASLQMSINSL